MKIGIYDVDSTIPNLALMKLSAWHKQRGDNVSMYLPLAASTYDRIYASKIFDFSEPADIDPARMVIGGTGWDMHITLPPEIEGTTPDYGIYKYKHNIGFTMRGCRLKCSFCVVPEKEGKPRSTNTIGEIWTQRESRFLMLLDNDFFGGPEWSTRIDEILEFDLRVNFSQGLNIRNLKPHQAAALASVNFRDSSNNKRRVYFAWDDPRHEKLIHKGIQTCTDNGIKTSQMAFYILIGYHSTEDEDLRRVEILRDYGCSPFVMPYNKSDPYQNRFARWVNHKAIFNSTPWIEYRSGIKKRRPAPDQLCLC